MTYETIEGGRVPILAWTRGVPVEADAVKQLLATASLPVVGPHLAVMPDVHLGIGATVGSVVPTEGALVPAAVGVDIGCGMLAARVTLTSKALGDNGLGVFEAISRAVPHGRTDNGGANDRGAWGQIPRSVAECMQSLQPGLDRLQAEHPAIGRNRAEHQLGTLGGGNHFLEVCLDEQDRVWIMLHSGSRGVGNRIGTHFIALAQRRCAAEGVSIPNADLAWLPEGTPEFGAYVTAVRWAQGYAAASRQLMMREALRALEPFAGAPVSCLEGAVHCHHNYVSRERHFGRELWVTRKGAVSAASGELGIIPGAMGGRSFIVRGKGNPQSFHSCSHGAGRVMSRGQARRTITIEQHVADTRGLVCRKSEDMLDESLRAYKDVGAVMAAQADLVEVVHELHAVVCVKGYGS